MMKKKRKGMKVKVNVFPRKNLFKNIIVILQQREKTLKPLKISQKVSICGIMPLLSLFTKEQELKEVHRSKNRFAIEKRCQKIRVVKIMVVKFL